MKKILSLHLMMMITIAANAQATLGVPVWGVDGNQITEDQINLGVQVSFPEFVLPDGVNPMDVEFTVSATLMGIPEGNEPMPASDDDDIDSGFGVDGPVTIDEAHLHYGSNVGGVFSAYLFPEMMEVGNHYAIVLNSVMATIGEDIIAELPEDAYYATDFYVVENVVPAIANVEFTLEGEENITINNHSNFSVAAADGIRVVYENCEPQNATYAIDCVDAEGEVVYSVASGTLNRGYAKFENAAKFVSGYKYNVTIKAWAGEMLYETTLEPVEPMLSEVYTINGASATGFVGEPQFGIERGQLSEEMVNLGIKVSFPEVIFPALVDINNVEGHVTATLYGIPTGNEPSLTSGEGEVGDDQMGVDAPVSLGEVHMTLNDEGGVWSAYLLSEDWNMEADTHYALQLNAVTFFEGEEIVAELDDAEAYSVEFDVVAANDPQNPTVETVEFLVEGEENVLLNDHSVVSANEANAIMVKFNDCEPQYSTYAIDCVDNEGEVVYSAISGVLNRGYADFGKTIKFVSGYKYNVTIKAWATEDIFTNDIYPIDPLVCTTFTFNGSNETGIVGEPVFGIERGQLEDDMANLGIKVSFPEVILPALVDINNVEGHITATLYGIPEGNEAAPISGEGEVGDDQMGVDGPVSLGEVHMTLSDEAGVWSAYLLGENWNLEAGNHYALQLDAVTFVEGEEIVAELDCEAKEYACDFVVVPAAQIALLGEPAWGVEDGQITDDMINLGVEVRFPTFLLPEGINPLNVEATVSASLYGIPEGNQAAPINGEDEVGDDQMGVDGPVALAEAVLHTAHFEGGVLTANLFPEQMELDNHYAIVLNAVTVMNGEDVIVELPESEYYSVDFYVVKKENPSIETVEFVVDGEENILLNDHDNINVETANGLRVVFNDCEPQTATYAIDCVDAEGEYVYSVASGELNRGYAAFENAVKFVSGYKYNVTVKAWAQNALDENLEPVEPMVSATYVINGASATGIVGEPVFGIERGELAEDMASLGVKVSFPEVILPALVDINNVTGYVTATLYGIPEGNEPMPVSGEDEVGDDQMGVDGPVALGEATVALFDEGGVWSAYLLGENWNMEADTHYALQLNAVTFYEGEEIVAELDCEAKEYAVDFYVVKDTTPKFGEPVFSIEDGAQIELDDVHNVAIKLYFPDAVNVEGLALQFDVILQKQIEGEEGTTWSPVSTPLSETEHFYEDAVDATTLEFSDALFANTLQNAVAGETYRIVIMDYALIDLETGEPVIYEVFEGAAYVPSVTFTVVENGTGINGITINSNDAMFNIAGQRVNTAKGIVIVNGKKYMVK